MKRKPEPEDDAPRPMPTIISREQAAQLAALYLPHARIVANNLAVVRGK